MELQFTNTPGTQTRVQSALNGLFGAPSIIEHGMIEFLALGEGRGHGAGCRVFLSQLACRHGHRHQGPSAEDQVDADNKSQRPYC